MKKLRIFGLFAVAGMAFALAACSTPPPSAPPAASSSTAAPQNAARNEDAFQSAITADPDNARLYFDRGLYLYTTENKHVLASELFERAVELDPAFRYDRRSWWTPSIASRYGINVNSNIEFSNFSLYMFLGAAYYDSATNSGTNREQYVAVTDRQQTLEKALAAYRRGYAIDITGGRNNNRNLQTIYLASIASILDLLDRTEEANTYYAELARITTVSNAISSRLRGETSTASAQHPPTPAQPSGTGTSGQGGDSSSRVYDAFSLYIALPTGGLFGGGTYLSRVEIGIPRGRTYSVTIASSGNNFDIIRSINQNYAFSDRNNRFYSITVPAQDNLAVVINSQQNIPGGQTIRIEYVGIMEITVDNSSTPFYAAYFRRVD